MPTSLPDVRKHPCYDCPWRRISIPGWLGPWDAETWIGLAQSDQGIACHTSLNPVLEESEQWSDPDVLQCAGAATFRSNICKSPRDPAVATLPADRENVFARPQEFLEHHVR